MIDDRTEELADKDQAADGWREWLRISNALNLREQPTIITAVTDATCTEPWRTTRSHETVRGYRMLLRTAARVAAPRTTAPSAGRSASSSNSSRGTRTRETAQPIPVPVVGYEAEDGIPIDFAWPDTADSRLPGPGR